MSALLIASISAWLSSPVDRSYELAWRVPEGCPSRAWVVAKADELIGERLDEHVFVDAEADVEAGERGFVLTLRTTTAAGSRERTIESVDCAELASATALLLAIAVQPSAPTTTGGAEPPAPTGPERSVDDDPAPDSALADAEPRDPAPEQERPADVPSDADSVPVADERAPIVTEAPRFGLRGHVVAGVGLSVGIVPAVTPSVRGGAGLGGRRWRVELSALHRIHRVVDAAGGAEARLGTVSGDVRGCGIPSVGGVRFPLCLGVEVGGIGGESRSVANPARGWGPLLAAHGGAGLEARVGPHVGLGLDAAVVLPVIRAGFAVDGIGELHRVGAAAFDGGFSLRIDFG